jgi:hypothetical protein
MKARTINEGHVLKDPVFLICQKCNNKWLYRGRNPYFAICSWCKSTVQVRKHKLVATATGGKSLARPDHPITVEANVKPKEELSTNG